MGIRRSLFLSLLLLCGRKLVVRWFFTCNNALQQCDKLFLLGSLLLERIYCCGELNKLFFVFLLYVSRVQPPGQDSYRQCQATGY